MYTWNRTQMVFLLYIKSIDLILEHSQFLYKSRPLHFGVPRGSILVPSSSQYTSSLYMTLLANFQILTITYTLMVLNSIPSYLTHLMNTTR